MTEVTINGCTIQAKNYMGQRVVTLKDIDNVFRKREGATYGSFYRHKRDLKHGIDYFMLSTTEARIKYDITSPNGLLLLTESGFLYLACTFAGTTNRRIKAEVEDVYFNKEIILTTSEDDSFSDAKTAEDVIETPNNSFQLIRSDRFGEVECDIYSDSKEMYMTAGQLGKCLGYSAPRESINKIVQRNSYLKNAEFSTEVKLTSPRGDIQNTRLFTEDGIYEVTMIAKTEKSKQFRSWVRKLIKSIRSGEITVAKSDRLEELKLQADADRAAAMRLNAENRQLEILIRNPQLKNISSIIAQKPLIEKPPETEIDNNCEEYVQASQLAKNSSKKKSV